MNEQRKEERTQKTADRIHEHAQQTGDPYAYLRAAQLYNQCGDYEQERRCYEAISALQKAER